MAALFSNLTPRGKALAALLLLIPVPSLGTWMAGAAAEGPVGQVVFGAAKVWVWLLPVVWLMLVDGRRPAFPRPSSRGMLAAGATGIVIFAAIVAGYWWLGREWIDVEFVRSKTEEVGLGTPARYLLGAAGWIAVNSLLEEYVWRWFVFTRCETLMSRYGAVAASGLFFTLHHIIALDVYFDWRVTVLGSLGVFIGGATWSWLYLRYRNIWAAYVSHVFADVAVFGIGWFIVFG